MTHALVVIVRVAAVDDRAGPARRDHSVLHDLREFDFVADDAERRLVSRLFTATAYRSDMTSAWDRPDRLRLRRDRRRAGTVVAVLSFVAAACGGSASTQSVATTLAPTSTALTTPPTVATTVTTALPLPSVAQDAAAAKRVLLRLDDLPGYKALSPGPSPFIKVYGTCTGNQLMPGGASGRSAGQGLFYLDETATVRALQTTGISSFAVFANNDADARRALADLAKPDVAQCVGKALLADVQNLTSPPATGLSQTSVALPALNVGQDSVSLRTTITSTSSQYFDLTAMRKGRVLAYLFVTRLGKAPPAEADRQRLSGILVSRMP